MYSELVYDYECRTVTPDEAAAMLGGAPKDNPHGADDACPAWEPLRVICLWSNKRVRRHHQI